MLIEYGRERVSVALLRHENEGAIFRVSAVEIFERRVQIPLREPPADDLPRRRAQQAEFGFGVRTMALIRAAAVEQNRLNYRGEFLGAAAGQTAESVFHFRDGGSVRGGGRDWLGGPESRGGVYERAPRQH